MVRWKSGTKVLIALLYAVMFIWISVGGVTLGSRQLLPPGPLTALGVEAVSTVAIFLVVLRKRG